MQSGLHPSIHAFKPDEWDALNPSRYPGLLHGFLSALEDSESVGEGTGWEPFYGDVGKWCGERPECSGWFEVAKQRDGPVL